ncbi:MAG TPA: glycosyltransferase family 4 protein, partial [Kofleriaceae bacterium]|nr:glycosyltransferase family 4 protein [Kofleriaceae bacterium]
MKIAVVAGSAPPLSQGGVATAHYNLFRFLRASGYDAKLFTHEDIGTAGEEDDIVRAGPNRTATIVARRAVGLGFRALEPGTNPYHVADILYSLTSARVLRRNVAAYDPDVLIVPDRGVPLTWLSPSERCRVIQIEHHNPARFTAQLPGDPPPSRRDIAAAVWLGQRALAKVQAVVCPTRYMRDEFEQTFSFRGSVEVIPHVVDEPA